MFLHILLNFPLLIITFMVHIITSFKNANVKAKCKIQNRYIKLMVGLFYFYLRLDKLSRILFWISPLTRNPVYLSVKKEKHILINVEIKLKLLNLFTENELMISQSFVFTLTDTFT